MVQPGSHEGWDLMLRGMLFGVPLSLLLWAILIALAIRLV